MVLLGAVAIEPPPPPPPLMNSTEMEVLRLVNEVRTNPGRFADQYLFERRWQSAEAEECYWQLKMTPPAPPMAVSPALVGSAQLHAEETGGRGMIGHTGWDGASLWQRVALQGGMYLGVAENISYGHGDPLAIVLQLLIDKHVANRGHRRNLLNPRLRHIGLSVRPHPFYRMHCVMDFAPEPAAPNMLLAWNRAQR
jgi:uncharacterized protein YkwD